MRVPELAVYLDVSPRRVQQMVQEGVLPAPIGAEYDARACINRYIQSLRAQRDGGGTLTLTDERTRLARASADEKELELAQRRGEIVETAWVVEAFGRIMETFRARMLAIPAKVAPLAFECATVAEVKGVVEKELHAGLTELSYPKGKVLSAYVGRKKRTKKTPRPR
jgi:hypothetical protein